ncbi:MAG: hypothetical protein H6654_16555 [Ardenticatenaceae bacterium]|nr:hypothetical protein [Anaerolineales bacterium]MCB8939744.1 hypothetical protein [Ardenticatenaceae bacterium]MCB8975172.1 hypothetical protein [Ardenticatenaceae bacterium]
MQEYEGYYSLDTFLLMVRVRNGRLTVAESGVPAGYEMLLEPTGAPHTFTLSRGPMSGVTAVFQHDPGGKITGVQVGNEFELTYSAEPPPATDVPSGQGLLPPEMVLDAGKEADFAALLNEVLGGDGQILAYTLPYPKHEFLRYLAAQEMFIFHGSAKPDIEEFSTRRTSMELKDKSGRGNVQGIYGTQDGLWPLFFAVVNRSKISGSIRNGVQFYQNDDGDAVGVYHFSINQDWLDKEPWQDGTLYILPRDTFRQMPLSAAGGLSNEWVSEVPVKPLVRLPIAPEEFPFLTQVGGHDDSELINLGTLGEQITQATTAADFGAATGADWLKMKLDYSPELGETILKYIPLAQKFIPTARFVLRFEPDSGVWLDVAGPPAVMQVMRDRVEKHLND